MNLTNFAVAVIVIGAALAAGRPDVPELQIGDFGRPEMIKNEEPATEISKTLGLIAEDLKGLKAKYPQLEQIDKATLSESQLAYTYGKVDCPSKARPCTFSEHACRLTVNLEQIAAREDADRTAAESRVIEMKNGRHLSIFYQVLAEPTADGKHFVDDANGVIAARVKSLVERLASGKKKRG